MTTHSHHHSHKPAPAKHEPPKNELTVVFHDTINHPIAELPYRIECEGKVLAAGVTTASGEASTIPDAVGKVLDIYVIKLNSEDYKHVSSVTVPPGHDALVLRSPKILFELGMVAHTKIEGDYLPHSYVVQKGDTIASIAGAKGLPVDELRHANNMNNNAHVSPGQVLNIPAKVAIAPVPPPPPPETPSKGMIASIQAQGSALYDRIKAAHIKRDADGWPHLVYDSLCDKQSGCIKKGSPDSDLILEINIRLAGFGGAYPTDKFTDLTEKCVKQFQRDYMNVAETGRVCGNVLRALDEFKGKYSIDRYFDQLKCPCSNQTGKRKVKGSLGCAGWGVSDKDILAKNIRQNDPAIKGTEYYTEHRSEEHYGIHRSVLWALRAVIFYVGKEKSLGYTFNLISSGYRCDENNYINMRHTYNHMGLALDLQFLKHGKAIRKADAPGEMDIIRNEIFCKYLQAEKIGVRSIGKIFLESLKQGASSWVHFDITQYDKEYHKEKFFIQEARQDSELLIEFANRKGFSNIAICGGSGGLQKVEPNNPSVERTPIAKLSLSAKGEQFIKSWESFSDSYYDDNKGHATAGWGHKLSDKSCAELGRTIGEKIEAGQAEVWYENDRQNCESEVQAHIKVPLFQHEYDALCSLAYNLGRLSKAPNLCRLINDKQYTEGAKEFLDITNHGDHGLEIRRKEENAMFLIANYDSTH